MTEAAREARNAYNREWRAKNRDKVKEYQQRHWEKVATQGRDQKGKKPKD